MSALNADDERWLDAAVRLAEPLLGTTADNPTVGALVIDPKQGTMRAHAVTAQGGRPHAEPQALDAAGQATRGATLYVTLEPCNHWGRTPPCVDAVIKAGIARVVIGIVDPDPRTAGQSVKRLRAAGIDVVVADHAPSRRLHEGHIARVRLKRPFVSAKLAVSVDGKIGLPDKGNIQITGEDARTWTHTQRMLSDAVLIGATTARLDNPQLTVRLKGLESRTPLRIILAGEKPLDKSIDLIGGISGYPVAIIATPERGLDVPPLIEIIRVPGKNGRPAVAEALKALAERGVGRLFVEGGATITERFFGAEAIDRFYLLTSDVFVGPHGVAATVWGTIEARIAAAGLTLVDQRPLGADMLRTFERA
ncbi:MAG: diaminohydroxyphosphoribosylaminopyrimidine deaminase [Hyphomicrobiales bacterium]|nr:diaminohydroxyphosphoribosylaminopyrimidine deaminase [Hyphomicrobiales bacterium]